MVGRRRWQRYLAVLTGTSWCLALAACGRPGDKTNASSSAPPSSATASPAASNANALPEDQWHDALAGPALFVIGSNAGEAAVILPHYADSTLSDAPSTLEDLSGSFTADLFARQGLVGTARLTADESGSYSGSCTSWPTAHVVPITNASNNLAPPPDWAVAFEHGRAISLPMDSMSTLSPTDSARRAADVVRIASAVPGDTAVAFHGLPFTVRDAHRFVLPDGTEGIAAELERRLNEEANPREQHILLVIERDSSAAIGGPPPYIAGYVERTSGPEDDVEAWEVLAGVLMGPHRVPVIVIGRDDGDGGSYTLLTRTARGRWTETWNSAYTGC